MGDRLGILDRESGLLVGWMIAVGAAAGVSTLAWRAGALSGTGAAAATVVGAAALGFAGLGPALTMVLSFVSSAVLSALPGRGERGRRGARQVLANGSVAAIVAAAGGAFALADLAFLGALAAATADTWATEIGVRFGGTPRSVLTLRPRPSGSSGAVSAAGTAAAAAGALAVALAGRWWVGGPWIASVTLAGLFGAMMDSVLGDGLQAAYHCPDCGASPEVARHAGCVGRATRHAGLPGLDNDIVNWITTMVGAAGAVAAHIMFFD